MPRVCIDFNGVLADSTLALCTLLGREVGVRANACSFSKNLVGKNMPNILRGGREKLLTREDYEAAKTKLFDTSEFLSIPPIPGAVEAVRALRAAGHQLVVVSDAKTVSQQQISAWFFRHGFPVLDVVLTHKRRSKEPYQRNCDFVIDDNLDNLIPLMDSESVRLVHFLPSEGGTGSEIAVASFEGRIPSLRGWDEILEHILTEDEAAEAA